MRSNELDTIIEKIILFKNSMRIEDWEDFQLDFSDPNKKELIKIIKERVGLENGFYAIFDGKICLYIGIGRPIWKRIKSHYSAVQGKEKVLRWSDFFNGYQKSLTIYFQEFNCTASPGVDDKVRMLIESVLENKYEPRFEFAKSKLRKDLEIVAIEAIAQSRYLICKKGDNQYCLTVVVGRDEDYPQDMLYPIGNVITFNAFTELESEEDKVAKMEYYLPRLAAGSIRKINQIFNFNLTNKNTPSGAPPPL